MVEGICKFLWRIEPLFEHYYIPWEYYIKIAKKLEITSHNFMKVWNLPYINALFKEFRKVDRKRKPRDLFLGKITNFLPFFFILNYFYLDYLQYLPLYKYDPSNNLDEVKSTINVFTRLIRMFGLEIRIKKTFSSVFAPTIRELTIRKTKPVCEAICQEFLFNNLRCFDNVNQPGTSTRVINKKKKQHKNTC